MALFGSRLVVGKVDEATAKAEAFLHEEEEKSLSGGVSQRTQRLGNARRNRDETRKAGPRTVPFC